MNRKEILRKINEYTLNNDEQGSINLLCRLIESDNKKEYIDLIYMLIDSFQLYGYINSIDLDDFKEKLNSCSFDYKLESYQGKYINYLNNGQLSLIEVIEEENKVIISVPTSFGKTSLLIEYILKENLELDNIIFIVPTNSLIEELYIKFLNINKDIPNKYNVTINTSLYRGRTLRILTPEKFLTFYEYNGINNQDLIVMDETYKIEDNKNENEDVIDNRSLKFRKVLEIIGKSNKKVILLSPYTYTKEESMKKYMDKYNIKEENRNKKYVEHIYHDLTNVRAFKQYFDDKDTSYREYDNINKKVIKILEKLEGQENVVYINNPSKAIEIIKLIKEKRGQRKCVEDARYTAFLKHLENNYNTEGIDEWYVITALKYGFGVYVSSMPRYIKREIVKLFDKGIIKNLIVTTAFVEGVNSSAKNIIITSGYTGGHVELNEMSLLNISGRAGRFGNSYIGRVFFIDKDTYKKVEEVKDKGVSLENPNYKKNNSETLRKDYEIEMIEEEYLNQNEILRKQDIINVVRESNLNYEEINNLCISVPSEWKVKLYNYFEATNQNINMYKEYIKNIIIPDSDKVLEGITKIFYILKDIDIPFYNNHYDIYPFKRNGEFLWGILYQQHANGNIKKVLISKKYYILSEQKRLSIEYFENTWMKKYFDSRGNFLDNKLYEGTFKFISNVIEYKIPYYINFFVGMFKYYLDKHNISFDNQEIDLIQAIDKIENIGIEEKMIPFYDYGFPKETLDKIAKLENEINSYEISELTEFDDYEKIMIIEYIKIMY